MAPSAGPPPPPARQGCLGMWSQATWDQRDLQPHPSDCMVQMPGARVVIGSFSQALYTDSRDTTSRGSDRPQETKRWQAGLRSKSSRQAAQNSRVMIPNFFENQSRVPADLWQRIRSLGFWNIPQQRFLLLGP